MVNYIRICALCERTVLQAIKCRYGPIGQSLLTSKRKVGSARGCGVAAPSCRPHLSL